KGEPVSASPTACSPATSRTRLGPLRANLGPPLGTPSLRQQTLTHPLLTGSPAIDAGPDPVASTVGCPPTDQGGVTRPRRPRCDGGAGEALRPQGRARAPEPP